MNAEFFEELYGRLRTECHYTTAQIDVLDWDEEVLPLFRYWQRNPPHGAVLKLIAQALGVKFPDQDDGRPSPMTHEEAQRLMGMTGGKGVTMDMVKNSMGN